MLGLPSKLREIEGIHHAIYADDITIWADRGSDGQIEHALQTAIHKVEEYLQGTGLKCSPSKSELLLYRPTRRGMPPKSYTGPREYEEIGLYTQDGNAIPKVNKIKILGMIIEANGANGETVRKIEGKVTSATRLIKRITNRHAGMKEENVIRLIHSFVVSHIAYVAAYHNWYVAEKNKINTLIRKTYKIALGLPESTSTELLTQLAYTTP